MNKAYKFRIYPTSDQACKIDRTIGCARFIYNHMLAEKIRYYQETSEILHNTPAQYKDQFPWLREVDSLSLANAQLHLQNAFKNFFENKHTGFPKFKSKKKCRWSYATNNQKGSIRIVGKHIKLPRIGFVNIHQHRELEPGSEIKTVTVSKTRTGKYFVSILVEYETQILPVTPQNIVGLDFSMPDLFVSSDGESGDCPKYLRKAEKQLAKLQRKFSRTQQGSNNHKKMCVKLAALHEKTANKRNDFLHKKSRAIVDAYDAVGIEALDLKGMARKHSRGYHFGKSIADTAFGKFRHMLGYKLLMQGKRLITVDKMYPSSQLCSVCGEKHTEVKNIGIREWTCPVCGTHHNRDINAAINIRNEAARLAVL